MFTPALVLIYGRIQRHKESDLNPMGYLLCCCSVRTEVPRHRRYLFMNEAERAEMRREVQQDVRFLTP